MSKVQVISKPTRVSDLTFEELYGDISDSWEQKAAKLQARRWRKLRRHIGTRPNNLVGGLK